MEVNKFDTNIKNKLEGRRLQPASDAWAKLSNRLEQTNKKQQYRTFWWLGIAASFVGILFVAFQLINNQNMTPIVVDAPTGTQKDTPIEEAVPNAEVLNTIVDSEENKTQTEKQLLKQNFTNDKVVNSRIVVKNAPATNEALFQPAIKNNEENLKFEAQKIKNVVATVEALKSQHLEVTDAVIDDLLQQAYKDIQAHKMSNTNAVVVDARSLLREVETDLDQSFRSKVFEAIKASYGTIKTAVAQRNE